ncbi:MAG TPA: hypothetical protein DCS07_00620, partial [Bdellovibrionales bacterium]|nr:hypothetical protein [Bdellovibrionales bacterium]
MLKFPRWFQLLGLGALITLTQIIFMVLNGPSGASLTERYLRLNQWDSLQYRIIAEEGYRIPEDRPHAITSEDIHSYRANVVFFPGLPMMARGLSKLTSVPISYALLLTSQFCAWGFWFFWLLIGAQLAIPLGIYAVFTLCVFLYPSTFFLVAGYTESPFLAGLLAFTFSLLYWRKKPSFTTGPALFSILAAIGMSFIRIVSFAASPLPFLLSITNRPLQEVWPLSSGKLKFLLIRNWRALLLGLFCTTGAVVFFSWSHFQF